MARKQGLSNDEIHHDIGDAYAGGCCVKGTGVEVMTALQEDRSCSIKVVWISHGYRFFKGSQDAFSYVVQRVERVRLELDVAQFQDHDLEQMAAALAHPASLVWDLELVYGYDRVNATPVALVLKALERQGSTLLKLTMHMMHEHELQLLQRALHSPNCRLQHLRLYTFAMPYLLPTPQLEHTSVTSLQLEIWTTKEILSAEVLEVYFSTMTCVSLRVSQVDVGAPLLRTLKSGKCKLRHAHGFDVTSAGSQRRIVDWLEANPGGSRVEVLEFQPWESDTLKEYCAKILERNKRYRDGGLLDEDQVEVFTAKLFMCGHTGVGKTTITHNLVRTVPFGLSASLQRHRSTYGIDVHSLKFRNEQQLLVCDLAGQHEYHSFHHYFVRGSDKDVFAIVCRGPSADSHQHFKDELHYWLRFIAAHRGVSSDKLPTVIIVLNYFGDSDRGVQAEDRCKALVDSYKGVIHFAGVFGLVATSYSDVQAFKKMLGTALANLLETLRPKMPKLCHKLLKAKHKILKSSGAQSYAAELATLKEAAALKWIDDALIQLCFLHLHDMGEVVFFEKQQGLSTEEQGEQLVILDFQWFVREVIGIFVPRLDRPGETTRAKPPSSMEVEVANLKLKQISHDGKHTKYLMDVLQRLGVLIIDEENVKVLALLTQEFKAWPSDQSWTQLQGERSYWGRRFSCRNEEVTLMPSGVFAMLQVRLGDIFCHKIEVGNGWIHTVRNFVEVVVKIGGKTGDWHDRHWINVLLRFPEDRINDASEILTQVKDTIVDICSATHWGCPALELDEWVINPTVVMVIEEVDKSEEKDIMESLIEEAIQNGSLGYGHTWNPSLKCTPLKVLLTPDEQRSCMEKYLEPHLLKIVSLDNLQHEVEDHLIKVTQDEGSGSSAVETTTFATKSEEVIFKLLKENNRIMRENNRISREILSVATETLHEVKDVKKLIEMKSNQILSMLLLNFDTGLPKYPYTTRSDNIFQTFFSEQVAGSRWRINFLCEYGTCHEVEGQEGIWHTEMPNWLRKSAPVLIPALRLLFFAGKVAATAALGPNVLPPQADSFLKRLESAAFEHVLPNLFGSIDSSLTALHLTGHQGIREEELREFCSKLLEGRNVEEELGLHKVVGGNSMKWVCDAHKGGRNTY